MGDLAEIMERLVLRSAAQPPPKAGKHENGVEPIR